MFEASAFLFAETAPHSVVYTNHDCPLQTVVANAVTAADTFSLFELDG